jgi:uncharacterized protein YbbK (DUF523 family)/uncharacterized protein YbgA (DUF1722 family)
MKKENIKNNQLKPNVLISNCLELDFCRYNSQMISDKFIQNLRIHVNSIKVCPEVAIGMGTPRKTVSLYYNKKTDKKELIQEDTNINWTDKMNKFSSDFIQNLSKLDGAILKGKSPSCGILDAKIRGKENGILIKKGSGLFAEKLINKYPSLIIEDEKRLNNGLIRDNYLTKIYINFRFRTQTNSFNELLDFHKNNKYLFMALSQKFQKELGNILAQHKNNFEEVKILYRNKLNEISSFKISKGKFQNSLDHIFGYLKYKMNEKEKQHYFDLLNLYRNNKVFLITITSALEMYILKYEIKYLENQSIFKPYPTSLLMDIKIS